jgi:hypothetical protein
LLAGQGRPQTDNFEKTMQEPTKQSHENLPGISASTFSGVIELVRAHVLLLVVGAAVGAGIGFGASALLPNEWRASQAVQIGGVADGAQFTIVEPLSNTLERVQLRAFRSETLSNVGLNAEALDDARVRLFMKSAKAVPLAGNLIELDVDAYSKKEAQLQVSALTDQLIRAHEQLIAPSLRRLNDQLKGIEDLLTLAQTRKATLAKELENQLRVESRGAASSTGLILTELINNNDHDISSLEQRKSALLEQLDPQRTFNTRAMGSSFVDPRPVFPPKLPISVGGALLGIGVALCWALWRTGPRVTSARRGKNRSASFE